MSIAAHDPLDLHRGIRELVALSALPAAWQSTPTSGIPESLAGTLLRSTGAEFVFVRLTPAAGGDPVEAVREDGLGDGTAEFAVQRIGLAGERGTIVVGSRRPDFPSAMDRLLLEVGANQAAAVLQQRLAEERLQAVVLEAKRSAEQLRLALEVGRLGIGEWTIATGETKASARQEAIFGLASTGMHSSDEFRDAIHPDDRERVVREYAEAVEWHEAVHSEYRIVHPDGSVRWVDTHGEVLLDGNGRPERMIGVCADITERKQAEERLRLALAEAEEATRLKDEFITTVSNELRWTAAIIEHSSEAIIGKTLDGIITSWNPGAARLYGYSAQEIIGQRVSMLAPPDRHHEEGEILERIARGEVVNRYDTERITKDGRRIEVSLTASLVRDAAGVLVGASVIAHDISERTRAERRIRTLLEAAPDAMVAADHEGRIVLINAQTERLFGYARDELLGKPVELLVPHRFRAAHTGHRARFSASPAVRPMGTGLELYGLRKNGTEFPVEVSLSPLATEEGPLVASAIRDITDRKAAEVERERLAETLRLTEAKLAHLSRTKTMGELASSIAHEINQPLAAIVNDGAACLRWLQCQPPALDEARESVQHIIGDVNRASHVIARIRTLLARKPSVKSAFDANELVRETVAIAKREIAQADAILRTRLAAGLPPVMGDRIQVQQVLLNLLMNALEAMDGVNGRRRELTVASSRGGSSTVVIAVRDSGVGIPRDVRDRIFNAFYTTKSEGLGMGLAISRSIIEEHGGQLWSVEHEGPGAVLQFTIPVADEDA